jgi:hypothetical protein
MFYIYRTTNLINGKTYIGQHKKTNRRGKYIGSGLILRKAIKKYGKENFKVEILYDNIQLKETADSVEMFAIAKERKIGKAEYNIANGGQGGRILNDEGEKMRIEKAHQTYRENLKSGKTKAKGYGKGRHWFTNGKTDILAFECPEGFYLGRCNANHPKVGHRKNIGKRWYNNGITNAFCFDCPDGFVVGRIKWSKKDVNDN